MTRFRISALTATLCLSVLSACSNGDFIYGRALGDIAGITGVTTGFEKVDTDTPQIPVTAAAAGPPLIVGFEEIRVAIPLAGKSGQSQTYAAPDGVTISMNSGFVTRVIGLGIDMNGSYLPANSTWFEGLSGAAEKDESTNRVIEYWEKNRVKRDKFLCTLDAAPRAGGGQVINETCKRYFEPVTFVNRYWLRADDSIECSRQWLHPKLASMQFFGTEQQALTLDLTKDEC